MRNLNLNAEFDQNLTTTKLKFSGTCNTNNESMGLTSNFRIYKTIYYRQSFTVIWKDIIIKPWNWIYITLLTLIQHPPVSAAP